MLNPDLGVFKSAPESVSNCPVMWVPLPDQNRVISLLPHESLQSSRWPRRIRGFGTGLFYVLRVWI